MGKIITVKHEVAFDELYKTTCYADSDVGGWHTMCHYLAYRDRTHGRKAPVERHLPKCTLFDKWLETKGLYPSKCEECLKACGLCNSEE